MQLRCKKTKILSLMLAFLLLLSFAPSALAAELELEEIYDSYGFGEEIFICGTAPSYGVLISFADSSGNYKYMNTITSATLAEGVYLGINGSWAVGSYVLSVASGSASAIYYIDVVENRVDHTGSSSTGSSGGKTSVTATDISISETELELKVGESATVTVTGEKSTFKWTTDDGDKITIASPSSSVSEITAKKTGKAVVWVYCGNNYATLNITISPADKTASVSSGASGNGSVSEEKTEEKTEKLTEEDSSDEMFSDLDSAPWAAESINALAKAGIVSGMGDGTFAPSENVTRAQFVKMIVEAFDFTGTGTASFSDVSAEDWFSEYVLIAANNGIVSGYGENFGPNDSIICQDAALIVSRVLSMKEIELKFSPTDESEASEYARAAIGLLKANGIITDEMGFSAFEKATRAQSAFLIYGAYRLKQAL